ncbi:hypothetical protein V5O48_010248 [Marasmius crinis-equi]|uniref:Cytochrome P450 n=1 Tax=Marasmius crinis-equi TaxID=585013 RepID=A0ABR3F8U4_9AGAR
MGRLLVLAGGGTLLYVTYRIAYSVWLQYGSADLYDLPGPESSSYMYGNLVEIVKEEKGDLAQQWAEKYGKTMRIRGLFGMSMIWTSDCKLISHVLKNDEDFQKNTGQRFSLSRIVGSGVLVAEGEKHRIQRKVMNPAFGPTQVRELTEIFVDKSIKLRNAWATHIDEKRGSGCVDAISWLSKMTLDVIGEAGFHYSFNALDGESNELSDAYAKIFRQGGKHGNIPLLIYRLLQEAIPATRILPEPEYSLRKAQNIANQTGKTLLRESKAALNEASEKGDIKRTRDLLSLLVKSNMSTEGQSMSEEDVLSQVPTFLVAGHETTSTSTTFALLALTDHPDIQSKLREELLAVPTDNPTMEELNNLPYLDAFIRETLRFYPPVPITARQAMKDDVIPLSTPYTDKKGVVHHEIRVKKGTNINFSIPAVNHDKDLWGEDAGEFKPQRWEKVPEAVTAIPGVWGNMMTFHGGSHACIGWRFSLVE